NRAELVPQIAALMTARTTDGWLAALETVGVPCGPINTLDRVFADPQVEHRGLKVTVPHPTAGEVPLVASPMRFSATPVEYERAPPLLGEQTEDVLADLLGLDAAALDRLRGQGIV
ncbi:MAG TPA: CoA transferase, partial [Alphaproteobacteria bacterium]|nr:CoA transferase [Alphaproteobacteria bacterium]